MNSSSRRRSDAERPRAKLTVRLTLLLVLSLTAVLTPSPGSPTPQRPNGRPAGRVRGIPTFATILGVRIGFDTEADLERRLGKGEVCLGGHSNSGRYWRFHSSRGGLSLYTDGFDLRDDEYVLDTVMLSDWRGALGSCYPISRYRRGPLAPLRRGMIQAQALQALRPLGPPTTQARKELAWRRDPFFQGRWYDFELTLTFSNDGLKTIRVNGGADPP